MKAAPGGRPSPPTTAALAAGSRSARMRQPCSRRSFSSQARAPRSIGSRDARPADATLAGRSAQRWRIMETVGSHASSGSRLGDSGGLVASGDAHPAVGVSGAPRPHCLRQRRPKGGQVTADVPHPASWDEAEASARRGDDPAEDDRRGAGGPVAARPPVLGCDYRLWCVRRSSWLSWVRRRRPIASRLPRRRARSAWTVPPLLVGPRVIVVSAALFA